MNKPRLWKYKSGLKIGKLRPLAKKYLSEKLKTFYQTKKRIAKLQKKIYYINFDIAGSRGYVRGSLSSSKKIDLPTGKKIINSTLPWNYRAVDFYEAEETGEQKETRFTLLREDEVIINQNVYY